MGVNDRRPVRSCVQSRISVKPAVRPSLEVLKYTLVEAPLPGVTVRVHGILTILFLPDPPIDAFKYAIADVGGHRAEAGLLSGRMGSVSRLTRKLHMSRTVCQFMQFK